MTLDELIPPGLVLAGVRATDKAKLLADLTGRLCAGLAGAGLAEEGLAIDAAEAARALTAREALGSTGVGGGIALPHAGLARLARPVGLLARLDRPMAYEAIDGRAVDLVALLLSPAEGGSHLHALAALSRRLRAPGIATALREAPDAAAMRTILVEGDA